jgi:hypothetical protein
MQTRWVASTILVTIIFILTACSGTRGPGPGPTPNYPECDPNTLISPSLVSPQDGSIISSLSPMFEWASPGYYIANGPQQQGMFLCSTAGFNIYLSSGPSFQDDLGGQAGGVPPFDSLYTKTWTPGTPLEPGREYRWSVRPVSQGVEGAVSEVRTFFTGPTCEAGNLSAPIPISPLNHWIVDDLAGLKLTWWYPDGCLPDSYDVEISPMMQFENSPLNENTVTPNMYWTPTNTLQDCTRYFWQVKAVKDGQTGQASQVYTFRVDLTGSCAPETLGMIQGTVWEDQCVGPGAGTPMPNPLPLGCVPGSPDGIFTNQSYDPGEPGIGGLVVSLWNGACPSSSHWRDVSTFQDGMYDFYMVSPGTYCVMLDTKYAWNGSVLIPGGFTFPLDAVGYAAASQTIEVSPGQDVKNVNFGWWYKYGTAWGSTDATVFGIVWHDMCAYTPGDPVPDPLPAGCVVDQYGNVSGDGIRQADEPGIPGVTVDIGVGDCPNSGSASAVTDANGYYVFDGMTAGKYCLRIDPAHGGPNEPILMPGIWTYIPGGHENMTFRLITLTANHTLPGVDFGWDFANLPQLPTPTPVPQNPEFTLTINAYCRLGPDVLYGDYSTELKGQTFPIVGRNLDDTWYFVRLKNDMRCWFAKQVGTASGDLSQLHIFYGPPLPTDTPPESLGCSLYTDPKSCAADPVCKWNFSAAGPGFCSNK